MTTAVSLIDFVKHFVIIVAAVKSNKMREEREGNAWQSERERV